MKKWKGREFNMRALKGINIEASLAMVEHPVEGRCGQLPPGNGYGGHGGNGGNNGSGGHGGYGAIGDGPQVARMAPFQLPQEMLWLQGGGGLSLQRPRKLYTPLTM